ncbi:sulfatase-like hydrolase/transferase [Flammeovirga sp. EKP202]|uniref:sulfatase-like hydrolase/transferase n=1 Tax=Flammeovirga sp. EKP202 TaxID=2770592 RepID=UPI00165F9A3E|nr:sulfatase-like hydrolase/transferase [Flammeovirga sp. EKP202]MBD0400603.1 sulfatase-like hydrolase/transferase [Flammeovirga sp. EKP202]
MKNIFIAIAVLFAISSCQQYNNQATASSSSKRSEDPRPNIIFVYADDWGFGDLSSQGSSFCKTPNLDQMAAEGIAFKNFSVVNPVCSPSRTSIMTGHFPARHFVHGHFAGVESHVRRNMPDWLDPKAPMLPRMLKDAGYATAHYGKWHLSNTHVPDGPSPLEYGYDDFECFNIQDMYTQLDADSTMDRTIKFVEKNKDKPFFINAWIHATHTPHYPKTHFLKEFEDLGEKEQVYAAIVKDADHKMGLLFAKLKELGIDDNTLVIFSSDNGPAPNQNREIWGQDNSTGPGCGVYFSVGETAGLKGQKASIHAGGVRVPFLVRWPKEVPAGKEDKVTALASVDMLPTFVELAKAKLPKGYVSDGQSVVRAFKGQKMNREKSIFWQWKWPHNRKADYWASGAIQEDNWRLLFNEETGQKELYNLTEDWKEQDNVVEAFNDKVIHMMEKYKKWEKTLPENPSSDCFSAVRNSKKAL